MQKTRSGHSSCALGDKVYVFSGGNEYGEYHSSIEKLIKANAPVSTTKSWQLIYLPTMTGRKKLVT